MLKIPDIYRIWYLQCFLEEINQIHTRNLNNLINQKYILNEANVFEITARNNRKLTDTIKREYKNILDHIDHLKRMDSIPFNESEESMFTSRNDSSTEQQTAPEISVAAQMIDDDFKYIKSTVGFALRKGLAEIVMNQPEDPISYLANFLQHFQRNNEQTNQERSEELPHFTNERELINKDVGI